MRQTDSVIRGAMSLEERLHELMLQLEKLGYTTSQQKAIIHETVGSVPLQSLTKEQEACLIEALDEYIRFGLKCYLTINDSEKTPN